jgi:dihydrodiol dehydrogenase / D-xylose 1-dehydrogenase (NADP)
MTMNSQEQEDILEASKRNNRFFMEAIWTRWFPAVEAIQREIANGAIGELKYYSGFFLLPVKDMERVKNKALGGGTTLE